MSTQLICPNCGCITWTARFIKSVTKTMIYESEEPLQLTNDDEDKYWGVSDESDDEMITYLPDGREIETSWSKRVIPEINDRLIKEVGNSSNTLEEFYNPYISISFYDEFDDDEGDMEIEYVECTDCNFRIGNPYNIDFRVIE